jgi:hypothetical protein
MFAALEYFEDELVTLLTILTQERFDVLYRRRLERFEAVAFIHFLNYTNDVFTSSDIGWKKIAHAARGLCLGGCHVFKITPKSVRPRAS